ncbi:acetolactate synthase small subunit [Clostridia bacterium]|nr:acetolactate synthase small subunit [Clostridia bacterium]
MKPEKKHNLSVLVENHAGVLSQVTRLFSRRAYNIESLAVGITEDPNISRISIIVGGTDRIVEQIVQQLSKLVCTKSVEVLPHEACVSRELLLVKVRAEGQAARSDIIQTAGVFRAKIVDVNLNTMTLEISGQEDKNQALLELISGYGIVEIARTGTIFLQRGERGLNSEKG